MRRTKKDPNEFIFEGDDCFIILYNNFGEPTGWTVIDKEDYEKCKDLKWHLAFSGVYGYAANNKVGKLHNYVKDFIPKKYVRILDHKDGNTLNNRKRNLQICTPQQNQIKKKMMKNNKTGYRGVYELCLCCRRKKRFLAQISVNQKHFYLGTFFTKEEAALVYNEKAKRLHGRFAILNKVQRI